MYHPTPSTTTEDFDAIRLRLASPDDIMAWSHGEVTRPETINYRTQKPEKDGLFDERIFGPSKDWECYCGKYKKIRYKGIVCDKCGVEVTRAIVRRERMGHITLATPVSHIWFLRGVPSRIGLALDMGVQALERVVYFADFIVTSVNEDLKTDTLEQIKQEYKTKRKKIENDYNQQINRLKTENNLTDDDKKITELIKQRDERLKELDGVFKFAENELKDLRPLKIITEHTYQDLSLKYGHIFEAGIGAEAIRQLLTQIELEKEIKNLEAEKIDATGARKDKVVRRLRLLTSLNKNGIRPEWMVLTTVPIIPPDLRPMVALDGGRFATSDLNDLYRRVINRNNRLKQLLDLSAPIVIINNEKRMLQEAVDALIDNEARHGKTVVASTGQKRMLKSIADMLKGKQGRFRQNLLGKRIDYSGRSVIVVGPELKIDECGLPKTMALELFKPFVISQLIKREIVHNIRSANRYMEGNHPEVWDILEEVVRDAHVLLNRAPTLHRLGIQAFRPQLIEGKAIKIHPLVCSAFNADFDGDQMAVHVPLTTEARHEAATIMTARRNLLKPATGDPIVTPSQDIVWGCYYLTLTTGDDSKRFFVDTQEALMAYQLKQISLSTMIEVRLWELDGKVYRLQTSKKSVSKRVSTTVGRLIFNSVFPDELPFFNELMGKVGLGKALHTVLELSGEDRTVTLLDDLKALAFRYITTSGMSMGMDDLPEVPAKKEMVTAGDLQVDLINEQYENGLLTEDEKHSKTIEVWTSVREQISKLAKGTLRNSGPIFSMIDSGARGSVGQLAQMIGMKGLVSNPSGDIIELPVKANFKEGFDVLEYFISTHGARKGLTDTALRTATAGYLTRRLVDVSQDIVVYEDDCHEPDGYELTRTESETQGRNLLERVYGRYLAEDVKAVGGKKVLIPAGTLVNSNHVKDYKDENIESLRIRSLLTCKSRRGVCRQCYGIDLGYNSEVAMGTAVGIIAAQSIGEPGTQLTMRTFHTGGVAAGSDITQGLPRVEELFEVRTPRSKALLSEVAGRVSVRSDVSEVVDPAGKSIKVGPRQRVLMLQYESEVAERYHYDEKKDKVKIQVTDGQAIKQGQLLFIRSNDDKVLSEVEGIVALTDKGVEITHRELATKEMILSADTVLMVKDGDTVRIGQRLTEGSVDLQQLFRLSDKRAVEDYITKEIQHIYSSQGQKLHDKHIEVIIRQLFSKIFVKDAGDTELLPGEVVDITEVRDANEKVVAEGKQPADFDQLLLGVTKVSLSTRSWLAAASFQETSRVLINAAITGKVDTLDGLKENIIIGRLIPAGTGYGVVRKSAAAAVVADDVVEAPVASEIAAEPATAALPTE